MKARDCLVNLIIDLMSHIIIPISKQLVRSGTGY